MLELKGKYNKNCKIFADEVESEALSLIQKILDQPVSEGVPVRVMCDVHTGKDIVIGFTMPLTNLLNPNHIGVDIGCGMTSGRFNIGKSLNLEKIDIDIKKTIPMGFEVNSEIVFKTIPYNEVQIIADRFINKYNEKFGTAYVAPTYSEKWLVNKLKDIKMDAEKFWKSIGTLGSGNHFLEFSIDDDKNNWITVHTGSRNFGLKIANYWTNVANGKVIKTPEKYTQKLQNIIQNTFDKKEIPNRIKDLKKEFGLGINKDYLKGDDMMGYLLDMIFAQQYALWNRTTILNTIKNIVGIKDFDEVINTTHNYIDFNDFIIRKGAISSYKGDKMIIPFNMRDGILLCEGKSNKDWNFSAPHGSGRLFSRSKAKEMVDLKDFQETMKNVYSTSVCKSTIDESPFCYKNSKLIEELIEPTAKILNRLKPILNIKDTGKTETFKERKLKKKENDLKREKERKIKRG